MPRGPHARLAPPGHEVEELIEEQRVAPPWPPSAVARGISSVVLGSRRRRVTVGEPRAPSSVPFVPETRRRRSEKPATTLHV